jgi:CRISPR-associated endonuclease/helicase Cas3
VEASLDIDVDVLFTEIAPLDALVQRMGRVLRRYGPMTSPDNIPSLTEPNVFVWVFKNGLQSGRGYVYDQELLLLTLKLLKDKSTSETGQNAKEWLEQKKKSAKSDNTKLIQSVLQELFGSSYFQPFDLSEYDKYELVKRLYESLPKDSRYLTRFYQTKDILDAGYMADRKEEAEKLFREIYTVSVVPSGKKEEFLNDVCKFSARYKDGKRLYTRFKREILSKFVVQLPLNLKQLQERNFQPVEWWVRDLECDGGSGSQVDARAWRRFVRWCRDIYFANYEYDKTRGVSVSAPWDQLEAVIL